MNNLNKNYAIDNVTVAGITVPLGTVWQAGTRITNSATGSIYVLISPNSAGDTISSLVAADKVSYLSSTTAATPVNAVSSAGTLTLTGVVIDGEVFTVGSERFEIDTDGNVSSGNIAIDVSAHATASQATLTVTGGANQIADADTVTIDAKVYTFKTTLTPTEGEVLIGANDTAALLNLLNAVNHTGTPDTDYSCAAVHPTVEGTSSNATTLIATVKVPGTLGDAIDSLESAAELSWDATTFGTTTAGVDCTAANADGVIVTDASAGSTLVTATQDTGTKVIFTVDVAGVLGNAFDSVIGVMANGTFGAATLGDTTLGVDGTVGDAGAFLYDATNLYMATAINTIADANWKKLVLQSL